MLSFPFSISCILAGKPVSRLTHLFSYTSWLTRSVARQTRKFLSAYPAENKREVFRIFNLTLFASCTSWLSPAAPIFPPPILLKINGLFPAFLA